MRGDSLARPDQTRDARARTPHRWNREAAGHRNIDYSPAAHQEMTDTRFAKVSVR